MRILSITAQKPSSTGSGVYLTEVVKALAAEGHQQAVVAGITHKDKPVFPEGAAFYPVYYETEELPFPVAGMSDEMPYKSTRYCDFTEEMSGQFRHAFLEVIHKAVDDLDPELILCHHLYFLTALVREEFPDRCVCGFCHNTDLRQMEKNPVNREWIRPRIPLLDKIFVPQKPQGDKTVEIYGVDPQKIVTVGMGFNDQIFRIDPAARAEKLRRDRDPDRQRLLVFAGKIAEKKGVMSLIRALDQMDIPADELQVILAGGAGNEQEYSIITDMAEKCQYPVKFAGRMAQEDLAELYNRADVFVLPSFFDGIPLVVIEALACGDRVVVSSLPGIDSWLKRNAPGADVRIVKLPAMKNADEPDPAGLPLFERELAEALEESLLSPLSEPADVSRISWRSLVNTVIRSVSDCRAE
ncbi:MAG: glycosyltransferase family 4 protein [Eubacterium sp.]